MGQVGGGGPSWMEGLGLGLGQEHAEGLNPGRIPLGMGDGLEMAESGPLSA